MLALGALSARPICGLPPETTVSARAGYKIGGRHLRALLQQILKEREQEELVKVVGRRRRLEIEHLDQELFRDIMVEEEISAVRKFRTDTLRAIIMAEI